MPATHRELHINLGPAPSPVPYALPEVGGPATSWITYSADYIEDTQSAERGSPVDVYAGYLGSRISTVKSSLWAIYCTIQVILFGGNTTAD
ncbi:hypothetical protein CC1G_06109 [Coprinopsis cinerea okayama7|uniref:Uncharacterized protein n=1 Tax=Coprinopsis cinerea (strain Okayama-7 / 130 / ATCC MYA-4618 / FGSC 9003) TaxID=240176 RepID=A8PA71_COPC7|nr:hypothetical protein CC1G_06109 [Coprinopsis cinerea okayama7\|eukprot:XP_001839919.2 hypothetical protein CC1G_06109 [Coprinopsis cinerea okayama7\